MPVSAESPAGVQAKLTVNPPGDIYEREADRIAGVMAAPPAPGGALPPVQRLRGQPTEQVDVAPASVDQALAGSGRPLEPELRQDMEQRFGHDFSRVRVHTSALAERSARDLAARAYTVGYDIVFGAGGFAPGTQEGRRLITHELTHVVQQSGAGGDNAGQIDENRGGSAISQSVAEGRAVQRAPVPPAEIEMPAEYAFALDERRRTDKRYALSLGQQDAARIRKSGRLSSEDRQEINAKLRFFEGEAWQVYEAQIKPALVEVSQEEIEMPPCPAKNSRNSPGSPPTSTTT
jgi:hypothetical protein